MEIYHLKLVFSKSEKEIKKKFYYSILGAVLNLVDNDQTLYDNITKISYSYNKDKFFVYISIFGKKNFEFLVNKIFENRGNVFSVEGYKFNLVEINFNFNVLNLNDLTLKSVNSFILKFLSPTQVRNQNRIYTLPDSDKFLFSVLNKLENLGYKLDINKKDFKNWLKNSVLPEYFNLKTELVDIKGSKRAGVVGTISYIVYEKNENYQKILDLILQAIPYLGIGSGTKLGLGNVKVLEKIYK